MGIELQLGPAESGFGLWAEHLPALEGFLAVDGQWRVAAGGMGGLVWLGLDYGAARAGLELAGIALTPAAWGELRLIEAGARDELNREH